MTIERRPKNIRIAQDFKLSPTSAARRTVFVDGTVVETARQRCGKDGVEWCWVTKTYDGDGVPVAIIRVPDGETETARDEHVLALKAVRRASSR